MIREKMRIHLVPNFLDKKEVFGFLKDVMFFFVEYVNEELIFGQPINYFLVGMTIGFLKFFVLALSRFQHHAL